MRRQAFAFPIVPTVMGVILLVASAGAITLAQDSTTGASPPVASPTVERAWPPPDEVVTAPVVYVTKVTLPPHAQIDPDSHLGSFILSVAEGAICYTYVGAPDPTETSVIASIAAADPIPTGCVGAETTCELNADCILKPGDVVYLPTGSWITQSNTAMHTYGNVGDMQAVVYLSGYEPDVGGAPCFGGCG